MFELTLELLEIWTSHDLFNGGKMGFQSILHLSRGKSESALDIVGSDAVESVCASQKP